MGDVALLIGVTPTLLLLAAAWLCRQLIITRLRNSVQHEFNEKLERLRAQLAERGETIKSEMKARDAELEALRSTALAAISQHQEALTRRRLEAVDQVWMALTSLGRAKNAALQMQVIKFDAAAALTLKDENARKVFKVFAIPPAELDTKWQEAAKAKPYLTPMAWAYYNAYSSIALLAVMQLHMLANGIAIKDFTNHDAIKNLVMATLPHQIKGIEEHGTQFAYFLLDELEEALLKELRAGLSSDIGSKESLQQASEIVKQAQAINFDIARERALQQ
jgi:hypothetical protein